jgi:hypothetical protein
MVGTVNKDPGCCVVCVVVPQIIEATDVGLISKLVSKGAWYSSLAEHTASLFIIIIIVPDLLN